MTRPVSRLDALHHALRRAIVEQALKPGTKLPEDTVAEQFQVSRTIVRQALERLAGEELVVIVPNRGATVARPTSDEAHDLFDVRVEIEDAVIRRICGKLGAADVTKLEACVVCEGEAHRLKQPGYIRLAAEFHVMLAEMAGSPLLVRYMRQIVGRSALVLRLHGLPDWEACNISEHRDLIDALSSGNLKRSRDLMRVHLRALFRRALDGSKVEERVCLQSVLKPYAFRAGGTDG